MNVLFYCRRSGALSLISSAEAYVPLAYLAHLTHYELLCGNVLYVRESRLKTTFAPQQYPSMVEVVVDGDGVTR